MVEYGGGGARAGNLVADIFNAWFDAQNGTLTVEDDTPADATDTTDTTDAAGTDGQTDAGTAADGQTPADGTAPTADTGTDTAA